MKIGQGGSWRTRWWCWGVALLAAVAVLPGAPMMLSADEGPTVSQGLVSPRASAPYAAQDGRDPASPSGSNADRNAAEKPTKFVTYAVNDAISRIQREEGLDRPEAVKFLISWVENLRTADPSRSASPNPVTWHADEGTLSVAATAAGHRRIAEAIDAFRRFGTAQISVETRILTVTSEQMPQVLPDSTLTPMDVGETAAFGTDTVVQPAAFTRPLESHEGTHVARAQLLVEKESPIRFRVVDSEEGQNLINLCLQDRQSNIVQAPKVTGYNGQTVFVSDTSHTPFVVGVRPVGVGPDVAMQPQIHSLPEGIQLQLRPIRVDRSDSLHLDFAVTFSKIQSVDIACRPNTPTSGTSVQIPELATTRIEGGADLKSGQYVLLGGSEKQELQSPVRPVSWTDWLLRRKPSRQTQTLVLMLRAETLEPVRGGSSTAR